MDYLVISPLKDEARYVDKTLLSMTSQTLKPVRWIIVDDGSSDRSPELVEDCAALNAFIHLVRRPRGQPRQPGSAVVRAFNHGLTEAEAISLPYDFIVKLDCDLSFEADYFEKLLSHFAADPRLGIASGSYFESADGRKWKEVSMPTYHAAGASKVIRRACWEDIGGFLSERGWDTVDEIRATALGWRTAHFPELKLKHWKVEGVAAGFIRTSVMHGEIYYRTGGSVLFFLFKVLHRFATRPLFVGGCALLYGYLREATSGRERLVTRDEKECYRSMLSSRIESRLRCFPSWTQIRGDS